MSTITRKLVLSILTVVLTVVALGTTTFAWFTLTNTATVQPFQAEIVSDTGIEIALSDGADPLLYDWKTTITTQDVSDYMDLKYGVGSFRFNNVTFDGTTFRDLDGAVGSTAGYLTLQIHFRSPDATEIFMDDFSLTSGEFTWTSSNETFTNEHGVVIAAGEQFDVDAADAFRMSVSGKISSATVTTVYENPELDTNFNLGSGITNADLTDSHPNGALSFYHAITGDYPLGATDVTVPDTITAIDDTANILKVLDLDAGKSSTAGAEYYGTITVNIWFEGWDPNAYNTLLGQVITSSMHFTA